MFVHPQSALQPLTDVADEWMPLQAEAQCATARSPMCRNVLRSVTRGCNSHVNMHDCVHMHEVRTCRYRYGMVLLIHSQCGDVFFAQVDGAAV